jgi:pimeloyl-ACP methyl ester carboxylesterase
MATYVLTHGAWGGAHTWRLVRPLLREAGHEVFTPSLTGIGERAHLASPQVNLTTHVLDVANTILYEDLREIVLLGFSYGGMVVTGALEHVAERVRHIRPTRRPEPERPQPPAPAPARAARQRLARAFPASGVRR